MQDTIGWSERFGVIIVFYLFGYFKFAIQVDKKLYVMFGIYYYLKIYLMNSKSKWISKPCRQMHVFIYLKPLF